RPAGWDPTFEPLFSPARDWSRRPRATVDLARRVQLREQRCVQPLPHARLLPVAQPPPRSHPAAEAELLRQMLPADPRMQHEQDPLQYEPIIQRLATRITKPARLLRQHRLDPPPCPIPDPP